jgi:hypothetical protein
MFFLPRWWTERIGNCRADAMVVQGLVQPTVSLEQRDCASKPSDIVQSLRNRTAGYGILYPKRWYDSLLETLQ